MSIASVFALYMGACVVHAAHSSDELHKSDSTQTVILVAESSDVDDHQQALERSLQEFDEKLLRELEETQQARQENARQKAVLRSDAELEAEDEGESEGEGEEGSEGQAASAEGSDGGEESNETTTSSGQENTGQAGGIPGTAETEQSNPASQEQEGSSNTQVTDIPSGNDDDVIARQLREAAEAETDPEIKEKLWEEYRKYKNQQSSAP